jgi:hypothetical protein
MAEPRGAPPPGVVQFRPLTAREALLAIRARRTLGVDPELERLISEGLDRSGIENFELTDLLADRLAEAHKVLRETRTEIVNSRTSRSSVNRIDEALALPPDLEAMVERRLPGYFEGQS